MDISLAAAAVALQNGLLQQAVAMRLVKMNAQAEAEAARVLLGVPAAPAGLSAGVGGMLDVIA